MAASASVGAFDATQPPAEPAAHTPTALPATPGMPPASQRFGTDALGESPAAVPTESGFLDPADRAWNPLSDLPDTEASSTDPAPAAPAFEPPAYEAAFEAEAFDEPPAPAEAEAVVDTEFSFRPDPPLMDTDGTPLRRVTDALPPPPPAPPTAFDQFDAAAPPPPAPPSPADLVGSERVDGAEARRLLSGRGTERYDADDFTDEEDDGSLLMQYLRDES